MKNRQPIYKQVKRVKAHCPVCGGMLSGNNSIILPYECSCGVWERCEKGDYKVKKKN